MKQNRPESISLGKDRESQCSKGNQSLVCVTLNKSQREKGQLCKAALVVPSPPPHHDYICYECFIKQNVQKVSSSVWLLINLKHRKQVKKHPQWYLLEGSQDHLERLNLLRSSKNLYWGTLHFQHSTYLSTRTENELDIKFPSRTCSLQR